MKSVFATGLSGFVGRHFRQQIESLPEWTLLEASGEYDIASREQLSSALDSLPVVPDAVLHLAAQSNVPESFRSPAETFRTNLIGTLELLQGLSRRGFAGRFVHVGTADAYGLVSPEDLPVHEDRPLRPRNPYAVSKAAAEALVYQWTQTEGLDAVMLRPFNHIGPGQSEQFVVGALARQVAEITLGMREAVIEVGNVDVSRDFTDVRDIARAYCLMLERGSAGQIYNLGSGTERTVRSVLERILAIAGVKADMRVATDRLRKAEQTRVCASIERVAADVGWTPRISLDETLHMILQEWKETLRHE